MPLPNHGRLISSGLQMLRNIGHVLVDLAIQRHHAIDMVMRAGQNGSTRRCAYRVGHIAVIEQHSFLGDAIEVRRVVDSVAVRGYGFGGVVIGHDEQDVGACRCHVSDDYP